MNKKTLFIIIGVVVIILLGIGIFFWLKKAPSGTTPNSGDLPFGKSGENASNTPNQQLPNGGGEGSNGEFSSNNSALGLRKITDGPVSGEAIFMQGSTTIIRYVERATGNLFEYTTETNVSKRLTNTTIPKAEKVAWGEKGNSLVISYLKDPDIKSFFASIATTSATSTDRLAELAGNFLPNNISSVTFSPKKDKIFYTILVNGMIEGVLADKKGNKPINIWRFPTTEWVPQWSSGEVVSLTTKASNSILGYAYALNVKSGTLTPILTNIKGLTVNIGPDGNNVLYSTSGNSITTLYIHNIKTGYAVVVPFTTLPEKCAWVSTVNFICGVPNDLTNTLPDKWYQGIISFNDTIRTGSVSAEIISEGSSETNDNTKIFDLRGIPGGVDVVSPQISPDGKTLIFENKKDLSLWLLPIK
jgi:hypothetical protein